MRRIPLSLAAKSLPTVALPAVAVAAIAILGACSQDTDRPATHRAEQRARTAIAIFAKRLQNQLETAIKAGGAASAVEVCQTVAPAVTAQTSKDRDLDIARTALRLRNPANTPDAWERGVLQRFETDIGTGKNPANLWARTVEDSPAGPVLRYMAAIPTGGVCLTCHGEDIPEDVQARLDTLYPDDQATGFALGDLRGAFTVRVPLDG